MCGLKCCGFVALGFALFVGKVLVDLDIFKEVHFTDAQRPCKLFATELVNSEDITHYKNGIFLVSAGDIGTLFEWGAKNATPGGIYAFDVGKGSAEKLELENFIEGVFQPHGIFFSNSTNRVYAVSHTDEHAGSVIEIFDVVDQPKLRLRHFRQVASPLFGNHALNDVIEGALDGGDLYVTEWLAIPHPVGGKMTAIGMEKAKQAFGIPLQILKVPLARTFRCTVPSRTATPECTVAATGFAGANGITITTDRMTVFVNDPGPRKISVYERAPDGSLNFVSAIFPEHALDNIEFDSESNVLFGGSIPKIITAVQSMDKQAEKPLHGAPTGIHVPGGLLEIPLGTGGASHIAGVQSEVILHDGSVLSQVSAGIRYGDKVVLGSPMSRGIGVCTV